MNSTTDCREQSGFEISCQKIATATHTQHTLGMGRPLNPVHGSLNMAHAETKGTAVEVVNISLGILHRGDPSSSSQMAAQMMCKLGCCVEESQAWWAVHRPAKCGYLTCNSGKPCRQAALWRARLAEPDGLMARFMMILRGWFSSCTFLK